MRAFVYFNLTRKVWSIKALDGPHRGRVVAHATYVQLRDVECRVSEAGRQRVLREKRKNVHAGLVGTLRHFDGGVLRDAAEPFTDVERFERADGPGWFAITYNPYKAATFTRRDNGAAVHRASRAVLGRGFVDIQE